MSVKTLPHWDLTGVYPSLESEKFEAELQFAIENIDRLVQLFDERNVASREVAPLDADVVQTFETVLKSFDAVLNTNRTLQAYIFGFVSTDSRDALAQSKLSQLQQHLAKVTLLSTRWTAFLGSLDIDALTERSTVAQDHVFMLHQAKQQSKHLMHPEEEALAAELDLSAGTAWSKLHGTFTSQLMVDVPLNGKTQTIPMSAVRNLAYDPDRAVRHTAYEAELDAWEAAQVPLTAALNSIKGQFNTLSRRRHWNSALDVTLFDNHIDRQTLDAMMAAARESFPDFRRYLKIKARALSLDALAWYDLFAPLGKSWVWSFDDAEKFIVEQFGTYSAKMQGLARRAFGERWIDAEPRPGKRDGAFCMSLRADESRILSNYKPSYGGVSTLAHELGHAYHNLNLAACNSEFQRNTPTTLAETASIFCETIVRKAALQSADREDKIAILEASLQGACQVVVDISSRFLFESAVFQQRRQRELSTAELQDLMLDAQRQTYGDGLDAEALHPYMWAVKPHYYSADRSFYNFPYMFGLLFALGLYAQHENDPQAFKTRYDDLLSSTGVADATTLAQRFGIDIRTPAFWRSSLDVIRTDIDEFQDLIE